MSNEKSIIIFIPRLIAYIFVLLNLVPDLFEFALLDCHLQANLLSLKAVYRANIRFSRSSSISGHGSSQW